MTQVIEKMSNSNNWQAIKEAAITRLKESGELSGKNGAMLPLIKEILEAAIEAELSEHIKEKSPIEGMGKQQAAQK
jgi:putative transposase